MVWDVVATVREPIPLVLAFVAHHLKAGARCLHLYLDVPHDPVAGLLDGHPGVRLTRCDATYWSARGGRPGVHVGRQLANARDAAAQCRSDWLLHCDADEFLQHPRRLRRRLAEATDRHLCVRLRAWERCFVAPVPEAVFGGWQRGPLRDPALTAEAYGAYADLMPDGLSGYDGGKTLTRPGAGLVIDIHRSFHPTPSGKPDRNRPVETLVLDAPHLLHFDGLTARHTRRKMALRRAGRPLRAMPGRLRRERGAQADLTLAEGADADALFLGLRMVQAPAVARLQALDLLRPIGIDPARVAVKIWPQMAGAYDSAGFDRFDCP